MEHHGQPFPQGHAVDFLDHDHREGAGQAGEIRDSFAQLIFGIPHHRGHLAIATDCAAVGIAMTGSLHVGDVVRTWGGCPFFLVASLVAGLLAVPRLLAYITRFAATGCCS